MSFTFDLPNSPKIGTMYEDPDFIDIRKMKLKDVRKIPASNKHGNRLPSGELTPEWIALVSYVDPRSLFFAWLIGYQWATYEEFFTHRPKIKPWKFETANEYVVTHFDSDTEYHKFDVEDPLNVPLIDYEELPIRRPKKLHKEDEWLRINPHLWAHKYEKP